jgi:hypothetical protein
MYNSYLMLDEAKMRQAEIAREFESIRIRKAAIHSRKSSNLATKLLTLLASLI